MYVYIYRYYIYICPATICFWFVILKQHNFRETKIKQNTRLLLLLNSELAAKTDPTSYILISHLSFLSSFWRSYCSTRLPREQFVLPSDLCLHMASSRIIASTHWAGWQPMVEKAQKKLEQRMSNRKKTWTIWYNPFFFGGWNVLQQIIEGEVLVALVIHTKQAGWRGYQPLQSSTTCWLSSTTCWLSSRTCCSFQAFN